MTRDPLALAMLAAWLNVTVEQLPELYKAHTCQATMEAWARVADAAIEAAAKVCEEQQTIFASEQYAVGQPLSSFGERLACRRCAEAIRGLG